MQYAIFSEVMPCNLKNIGFLTFPQNFLGSLIIELMKILSRSFQLLT